MHVYSGDSLMSSIIKSAGKDLYEFLNFESTCRPY